MERRDRTLLGIWSLLCIGGVVASAVVAVAVGLYQGLALFTVALAGLGASMVLGTILNERESRPDR